MSQHVPLQAEQAPPTELYPTGPAAAVVRRRAAAARVRRRRLLLVDAGIGLLLAVLGLILAPGLAILALAAFVVLVLCAVWLLGERIAARRRRRRLHSVRGARWSRR